MGKATDDVQREIEQLRRDTDLYVTELQSRLRDATDLRAQVDHHPAIATGAGLALLSGLAFAGYAAYERVQHQRSPTAQLRKRTGDSARAVGAKAKALSHVFPTKVGERKKEGMLKKVLYAAMTAGMVALASFMARRMAETIWTRTMEERPPTTVEPQ